MIAFIKVISLSHTTTLGYESTLKNNPLSLSKTHKNIFFFSVASKKMQRKKSNQLM